MLVETLVSTATRGQFGDLPLCFWDWNGRKRSVVTGIYQFRPAQIVNVAARITGRLLEKWEVS